MNSFLIIYWFSELIKLGLNTKRDDQRKLRKFGKVIDNEHDILK